MSQGECQVVTTEEIVRSMLRKRTPQMMSLLKQHDENSLWVIARYDELKKEYPDKYIAVRHRQIVKDDKNLKKLLAKLREEFTDTEDITIYLIRTKPMKLLL